MGSTTRVTKRCVLLVVLAMVAAAASKRSGVGNKGTTMRPGFVRMSGKASIPCPSDHPFSYGRGQYCCQHKYKLNDTSISPECNGEASNAYSDIKCCPNGDFVGCSRGNTCKTFGIAPQSCPFNSPYAVERGFYCCNSLRRLNNPGVNPLCDGGKLQVTDPKECCGSGLVTCPNNYTGCFTSKWSIFNATKMLLLGLNTPDMVMDLATNAITWSTNPSWPSYSSSSRVRPFGGAYDSIIIFCEGGGSNNCFRTVIGRWGWFAGPNPIYDHANPGFAMVQVSKLWVIGGGIPDTELFDFTTQTWSPGPTIVPTGLKTAMWPMAAPLDDNRVLVYGGSYVPGGAGMAATYLYDFNTGQWTTMGSLNTPNVDIGGGLIWQTDGTPVPVAAAGWNSAFVRGVELYNVTTNLWTKQAALFPADTSQIYHCMANGRLFVAGGNSDNNVLLSNVWEFNKTTLVFKSIANMPQTTTHVACFPYN